MSLNPIVHEYNLTCRADRAWAVYANRIGEWWHPTYSADPGGLVGVTIEPRMGGRVYAAFRGGQEDTWGQVKVWEPPDRLVHTSTLAQRSYEHPSGIAVSFTPADGGCLFHFEHGGWTEGNVADRHKFSDWPLILDRFAALANSPDL